MLVDTDSPGLEKQFIPVAVKASDKQWTLFFDDVEVPADRVVGGPRPRGLKAAFDGLNPERIMGAAVSNGVGRRALEIAAAYANERVVWARRSAPTRACRTRWRRRRSSTSWRG